MPPNPALERSPQVISHSDTIKTILIAIGAALLMASNAFASRSLAYLETIDLADLCIRYSENHRGFWVASVKDPDGYFHTVTVGSYIGKNFGRIMKITNDTVEVLEIIPDQSTGEYVERPLTLQVACPAIPPLAYSPSDGSYIRWLMSKRGKRKKDRFSIVHLGFSVGDCRMWRWVYGENNGAIEPECSAKLNRKGKTNKKLRLPTRYRTFNLRP